MESSAPINPTGSPPVWFDVGSYYDGMLCIENVTHRFYGFIGRKVTWQRPDGTRYMSWYNTN